MGLEDIKSIVDISEEISNRANGVLNWFQHPKEEARKFLVEKISKSENLTAEEAATLIYNSRKLTREYANSKTIYEKAKEHFDEKEQSSYIDDDWLHFFFDKAEKVSNKSMQLIWAKMLSGEFNKPGSISRKLMHIISIMDANSAKSFETFSYYVVERAGLITSYDTETVIIPEGFYSNSFDFMRKVETWLRENGYNDYRNLAIELTMNTGELNSLENLGLIQRVQDAKCAIPLIYQMDDSAVYINPQDDSEIPLGQYSLTTEGKQLFEIVNKRGNENVLKIIEQYLMSANVKFTMEKILRR